MNAMSDTGLAAPGEFRTSPTLGALGKALAAATGEFGPIGKDRTVQVRSDKGSYTFAYATLGEIVDATRPALSRHGLVCVQMLAQAGQRTVLVTRLLHESGEWMEGAAPVQPVGNGPQALGSAITYMRRYAYTALLGVVADEDDDGNAGQGNKAETRPRQPAKPQERERRAATASPWVVVSSSDGTVKDCGNRDEWEKEWRLRINAVETSKKPVPERRAKLEEMLRVNGGVFQKLTSEGHAAAVSAITGAAAKADSRLSEIQHAGGGQ